MAALTDHTTNKQHHTNYKIMNRNQTIMSSRRIKLFRGAMEMDIPDGLELDVSRPVFDTMERDAPKISNTWKIRKQHKRSAWNRKGSICFRDLKNFDTFINCTISDDEEEESIEISDDILAHITDLLILRSPTVHDIQSHIVHNAQGHIIGTISSIRDTRANHWHTLGLIIPIKNRSASINMNCTDTDVDVRWKQFLQAADSIEIL